MTNVYLYGRVSTVKQAERDLSIPDQLDLMRKHAGSEGWTVVATYVDAGVSGTTDQRKQFLAMVEDAENGTPPVDIILVHSFSRLFRESFLFEMYRRQLEAKEIQIVSVTEDFGEGHTALLMQRVSAMFAEWQSTETSKHVTRTRIKNARDGNFNGGQPRYGYRSVASGMSGDRIRKRLEPDPEEALIVRLIYKLRNEGDGESGRLGTVAIAEWLNTRGYRGRSGKPFYKSLVHSILTEEIYVGRHWTNLRNSKTGKLRPKDEWVLTECEPIVSEELFSKTQVLIASCRPQIKAPRIVTSEVLLGGLCRCAGCGGAMMVQTGTSHTGRVYRYYKCATRNLRGRSSCDQPASISEAILDDLVLTALCDELLTPDRAQAITTEIANVRSEEAESEEASLARLKKKQSLAHPADHESDPSRNERSFAADRGGAN